MGQINLGRVVPYYIGAWNSTREYNKLDVVSYNGSSYICTRTNKNSTPSSSNTNWLLLAEKGDKGDTGAAGAAATIGDGSITTAKIADGAVTESKLGTDVKNTFSWLESNFSGAANKIRALEETVAPIPNKITTLESNDVRLAMGLSNMSYLSEEILYLGNTLNSFADAYNMAAQTDVVTNCKIKIICFDTQYQKGGTIYQTIADNFTTQYLFFEGKTRSSYMRTFNATTGAAIHSWKEISFFTDFEFDSSDYKIYGYTAGKDNVGSQTKRREIINLSSVKTAINNAASSGTLTDGAVTTAKIADEAVTTNKILNNSVTHEKIVPFDFTTSKAIGKTKLNISDTNDNTLYNIECRTFSKTILNPLSAPYEYNLCDELGISLNDMIISIRGAYKGYDTHNNIIDSGIYPSNKLDIFYSDSDNAIYFSPVTDVNSNVTRMEIIVIFEYIRL